MLTLKNVVEIYREAVAQGASLDEAFAQTFRKVYQAGLEDRLPANGEVWINKKHGTRYTLLSKAEDCTNSRNAELVAVYCPEGCSSQVFTRKWDEWIVKFYKEDGSEG